MAFGLMTGIIGLFDTASEYTLQFIIAHTQASTLMPLLTDAR
jgi:hypothetical protein